MTATKYDRDTIIHGMITVAVLVVLYLLVKRLSGVLLPFLISWVIAYQMVPLVNLLQYRCHIRIRGLAVFLAMFLVLSVLVGAVVALVPAIAQQVTVVSVHIHSYLENFNPKQMFSPEVGAFMEQAVAALDLQDLLHNPDVVAAIQQAAPTLWNWISSGMSAISGLLVVFVCLLYVFFILMDHEKLQAMWPSLIPIKYRARARMVMDDLEKNMQAYFRGQALVATIVGILFAIGFQIIGLPMALVIGVVLGVLNLVPYMQALGIPVCVLLGFVQSAETGRPIWVVMLSILAVFAVVQTTQDMLLVPKIQGKTTGLNPAVMLLALSIWGSLLGVVGMIIALPVTTLLVSYYKRFVLHDADGDGVVDEA